VDSPSDAQLARLILRTLAGVIALTLAGGIASAAGRLGDEGDESADDVLVGTGALSPRGGLGPLPGTSVTAYVRAATKELADAEGRRAAVVSFAGYRTPEQAAELVDGADVVALLVALPGGRPQELAPDRDLAVWTKGQRDEASAEKRALEQLLPTVEDPDFKRQYQADIDHLAALLAVGSDRRDVVFGALVVGPSAALRSIGARPGVRMVDVDADATPPKSTNYEGVRPEETIEAGQPPTRPAD
jgi:hypothetical protein